MDATRRTTRSVVWTWLCTFRFELIFILNSFTIVTVCVRMQSKANDSSLGSQPVVESSPAPALAVSPPRPKPAASSTLTKKGVDITPVEDAPAAPGAPSLSFWPRALCFLLFAYFEVPVLHPVGCLPIESRCLGCLLLVHPAGVLLSPQTPGVPCHAAALSPIPLFCPIDVLSLLMVCISML